MTRCEGPSRRPVGGPFPFAGPSPDGVFGSRLRPHAIRPGVVGGPGARPRPGERPARKPPGTAKELTKQAERLYDQKKYLEAAELLEQANELKPDTRLVYNIARAYDQAGKATEAISYYEKYLTDGEDAQLRKRSRVAIDRLRLQKEKEEKAAAAAEAERRRLKEEAEATRRRMEAERESARRSDEANQLSLKAAYADAQASRKRMQVTSIALGGVALAGAGLGTVFGLKSRSARADFDTSRTWTPSWRRRSSPGATRWWRTSASGWDW